MTTDRTCPSGRSSCQIDRDLPFLNGSPRAVGGSGDLVANRLEGKPLFGVERLTAAARIK